MLKNNGIPAYTVDKESGDYLKVYMGYTVYGVDIFVNENDYDQAFALLSEVAYPKEPPETEKKNTREEKTEDGEEGEEPDRLPFSPLLMERHTAARMIVAVTAGLPCLFLLLLVLQSLTR